MAKIARARPLDGVTAARTTMTFDTRGVAGAGHETVTADEETFSQLCERMNLDTKQARLYWMFLGKYYGPSVGARTDLSVCTRRMPCPWGRTQRSALLVNGQVFPKPKGRLWNQLLEQQRFKDNGGNTEHESVRLARAYITPTTSIYKKRNPSCKPPHYS